MICEELLKSSDQRVLPLALRVAEEGARNSSPDGDDETVNIFDKLVEKEYAPAIESAKKIAVDGVANLKDLMPIGEYDFDKYGKLHITLGILNALVKNLAYDKNL